jgi:hypothetical protein
MDYLSPTKIFAGNATNAPLQFTAGALLTTPVAGATEFDGVVPYFTPVSNSRGILPATYYSVIATDFALANASGGQGAFPPAQNSVGLAGNTLYRFTGQLYIATGLTTHTTSLTWAASGGFTATYWNWSALTWSAAANGIATAQSTVLFSSNGGVLNATSALATTMIQVDGLVAVNAGGTIDPTLNFSAAPGAPCTMKQGSYLAFTPIGVGGFTANNWS